jgi:hypothetical protein
MSNISHEITAIFATAEDAKRAQEALDKKSTPPALTRISADRVLHVQVSQENLENFLDELGSMDSLEIKYTERPAESGWMGHHQGRVTGAGVAPGEGDSEAGMIDERRS